MDTTTSRAVIGAVALTVSDLERSLDFYQNKLGLTLQRREDGQAWLGSGEDTWLALTAAPGARKPPRTTGLYHYAVLLPARVELAQALRRLAATGAHVQGAADHGVSEAIYLADPDGNGIEIYRDRLRSEWSRAENGTLTMGPAELDIDNLIGELEGLPEAWPGMPPGTRVGHVHLHVANLPRAEVFYTGVLGFKLMQRYGAQAAFLSKEGYHHHVGINTWAGAGAPPPPPGSVGLRWFEIHAGSAEELEQPAARAKAAGLPGEERPEGVLLRDPSQNGILLTV